MLAGKTDDNVVRMEGIDYHAVDRMEVNTGALVDIVNVRGSSGMIGAGLGASVYIASWHMWPDCSSAPHSRDINDVQHGRWRRSVLRFV
jgi:hypothetical protein